MLKKSRRLVQLGMLLGVVAVVISLAALTVAVQNRQRVSVGAGSKTSPVPDSQLLCAGKEGKTCEVENDVNGTLDTANVASASDNKKHMGYISKNDVDYWKVLLAAGRTYQMSLVKDDNDQGGDKQPGDNSEDKSGYQGQAEIRLYDGTNFVSKNEAKLKRFTYTVSTGKNYFIKISSSQTDNKTSRYQFVVKEINPATKN